MGIIQLKKGATTNDPRLDRVAQFDPRSRNFPIRALIAADAKPRSYSWACQTQLDQGQEGACVGFGISHEAAAKPVVVAGITNASAHDLYKRAQDLDDEPGSDYEGTSVLAGAKAGAEQGWYPEYRWGFSLEDAILAIGHHGPVVIGVDWREGQMDTDANGFIHATGDVVGGHCVALLAVNVKEKWVKGKNSWGVGWGVGGNFRMSFDDLDGLLHAQGECMVPVKRAPGPKAPRP